MNQALIEKYRLHRQEYETQLTQYVQSIAELFDVPVAFLGLSDNETLWIKAKCGTEATEVPLKQAICHLVIDSNDLIYIEDTQKDPRTQKMPAVAGSPFVRFYAGVPVKINNDLVGSFCIIDVKPRQLSSKELRALHNFGTHLGQHCELIFKHLSSEDEHELLNNSPAALIRWQVRPSLSVSYLSPNLTKLLGVALPEDASLFKLEDVIHHDDTDHFLFTVRNHQQGAEICE